MDCFIHYRFALENEAKPILECFRENKIEFREIDNLILVSSASLSFMELAVLIYRKLENVPIKKSDYLYLYTVNTPNNWFCIIIKKIGLAKMYNIISRLKV